MATETSSGPPSAASAEPSSGAAESAAAAALFAAASSTVEVEGDGGNRGGGEGGGGGVGLIKEGGRGEAAIRLFLVSFFSRTQSDPEYFVFGRVIRRGLDIICAGNQLSWLCKGEIRERKYFVALRKHWCVLLSGEESRDSKAFFSFFLLCKASNCQSKLCLFSGEESRELFVSFNQRCVS